jgi:cystathionine beta-lyase/cystathionine gamma-synthase
MSILVFYCFVIFIATIFVLTRNQKKINLVFPGPKTWLRGPTYARTWSPARKVFETKMLALYNRTRNDGFRAFILPSGMTAIACAFSTFVHPKKTKVTLVHGSELYSDVDQTIKFLCDQFGEHLNVISVDVRDHRRLVNVFKAYHDTIKLFFFESASNPSSQLFDFTLIPVLKSIAPSCVFVADNTWLSAALFNPFEYAVDIVVESLTKYVSGSSLIGGCILGSGECIEKIANWIIVHGMFIGDDHALIFVKGLDSMDVRVQASSKLTRQVCRYLQQEESHIVDRVMHLSVESHPTYELGKVLLTRNIYPSVIWLHIKCTMKQLRRVICNTKAIEFKTSYGGQYSRIDPWPKPGHVRAYDYPDQVLSTQGCWIRVSVGYDDARIIPKLRLLFKEFTPLK